VISLRHTISDSNHL